QELVTSDSTRFDWLPDMLMAGKAVMAGKQRFGALSIGLPTAPAQAQITFVRTQGVVAALVASVLGVLLALAISQSIAGPLREMTAMTQRVSQGDLSQHIHSRGGGELESLAGAFNLMIDQLRQTIESLRQTAEEVRKSEARSRAMIDALPDAIFRISGQGVYLDAKVPAGRSLVGTELDLIGKNIRDVLPTDVAVQRLDYIRRALQTDTLQVYEYRLTDSNGLHDMEARVVVSGENEVLIVNRDVTDRKQAEAALKAAKEAAEAANRAKSAFLASMSHELRTPLNAILGFTGVLKAGMLKDALPLSSNQIDRLEKIENNGRHLRDLINDVLDLAKVEAGRMTVTLTEAHPRTFLNETVESMRSLATNKSLMLDLDFDPDVPEVLLCDVRMVQQIVTNLIGNAIKFTRTGGVWVTVTSSSRVTWQIAVRDTGIGIPDEALKFIFESFRQVDQGYQREFEGTGLGLALVKSMTELMQGTVSVQTKVGEGSLFTVTLPLHVGVSVRN
ncbi:MAG TPA: ATP-binding protein, partial [Aggregatilineales bacterium]|nr:ATP-binding protein [Aggregatilineales bacterium]